tara:strand:- start:633 stop:1151 length:519 start_codon:yes stop_codon:yes gene_type:complete
MESTAKLNYLRIAPRKTRLIVDLIRGKKAEKAQSILSLTVKKGSEPILKLLNSAIANAKNDLSLDPSNLYISKITVDEGRTYKRWRPRARGRAAQIQKKTSNITLVLSELKPSKAKKKPVKKVVKEELVQKETEVKPEDKKEIKKPKTRQMNETPTPKNRGGVSRMFRRKSF